MENVILHIIYPTGHEEKRAATKLTDTQFVAHPEVFETYEDDNDIFIDYHNKVPDFGRIKIKNNIHYAPIEVVQEYNSMNEMGFVLIEHSKEQKSKIEHYEKLIEVLQQQPKRLYIMIAILFFLVIFCMVMLTLKINN